MDKFTLRKDQKSDKWRLENEGLDRALKLFDRKSDATKSGALANAIDKSRGAVTPTATSLGLTQSPLSRGDFMLSETRRNDMTLKRYEI